MNGRTTRAEGSAGGAALRGDRATPSTSSCKAARRPIPWLFCRLARYALIGGLLCGTIGSACDSKSGRGEKCGKAGGCNPSQPCAGSLVCVAGICRDPKPVYGCRVSTAIWYKGRKGGNPETYAFGAEDAPSMVEATRLAKELYRLSNAEVTKVQANCWLCSTPMLDNDAREVCGL